MIGADDILVHYILKSVSAQFQPSLIFKLKRGFIAYFRWTIYIVKDFEENTRLQMHDNASRLSESNYFGHIFFFGHLFQVFFSIIFLNKHRLIPL